MIRMSKAATNASSSSGDDDNDSCNPQAAFKDGKPSNLELNKLAGKISAVWSTLGLHLGVGQNVLDTIEANEKAKAYRMLLRWKETTSSKALYRDLYYALCQEQVGLDNLAKEFCFVSAEGPSPPKRTKPEEIRLPAELSHSIAAHRSVEAVPTHHVMLSYQWNIKALVEKVYQGLRHLGINAWMDIHGGISGNINDSMAYGVEHAAVICCFMNGDYFSSKNCKKELNYADGLSKTIVPVMCEKGFKAQGWLGIITAGLLWIDFRDGTVFENSLVSLAKEIVNALDSAPESAIILSDSEMPTDASAAPVPKMNIQKKPGRAFVHKLTGKFLADSGEVKFHPESDSRNTVVMRDRAEDTSYWVEEREPKSEFNFFKNYATNGYLGMDDSDIYTKAQHYGAEEWILKADDQSTDGQRAVLLWNNFGKLYLAIRDETLVAVSSYSEDCVWILH